MIFSTCGNVTLFCNPCTAVGAVKGIRDSNVIVSATFSGPWMDPGLGLSDLISTPRSGCPQIMFTKEILEELPVLILNFGTTLSDGIGLNRSNTCVCVYTYPDWGRSQFGIALRRSVHHDGGRDRSFKAGAWTKTIRNLCVDAAILKCFAVQYSRCPSASCPYGSFFAKASWVP